MKNYLVKYLFILFFCKLSIPVAVAFEEEHAAHEHGHATLMLVQEKAELQLLFKSPAMNITGFEHQPNSPEQQAKVQWAKQSLSDAARLFTMSPSAECELEHVSVQSALLEARDQDAENHHDDHHSHSEKGHAKDEKDSHSEFEAEYHFDCKHISQLKGISVALFEIFTSLEEIDVQIINDAGQTLRELDRDNVSIQF